MRVVDEQLPHGLGQDRICRVVGDIEPRRRAAGRHRGERIRRLLKRIARIYVERLHIGFDVRDDFVGRKAHELLALERPQQIVFRREIIGVLRLAERQDLAPLAEADARERPR